MAFRKSIKGDDNEQNEVASHNQITVEGGSSAFILVIFFCLLATAGIILMVVIHTALVELLITVTFVGVFLCFWIIAFAFMWRQVNDTQTSIAVNASLRRRAIAESAVVHATDHYIVWMDEDGYQFRGSTVITENRQFLPREVSPPSAQEAILTCYDQGMSGRAIEKHMNSVAKDAGSPKVSYREIQKTLDLFRPTWTKKPEVKSDVVDAD